MRPDWYLHFFELQNRIFENHKKRKMAPRLVSEPFFARFGFLWIQFSQKK